MNSEKLQEIVKIKRGMQFCAVYDICKVFRFWDVVTKKDVAAYMSTTYKDVTIKRALQALNSCNIFTTIKRGEYKVNRELLACIQN